MQSRERERCSAPACQQNQLTLVAEKESAEIRAEPVVVLGGCLWVKEAQVLVIAAEWEGGGGAREGVVSERAAPARQRHAR